MLLKSSANTVSAPAGLTWFIAPKKPYGSAKLNPISFVPGSDVAVNVYVVNPPSPGVG
jgi:hypothetical protein